MRKRVIIAIPVLLLGGTEIHTLTLVRVLVKAGYRVMICCYYEFDNSVVVQFKKSGADVVLLNLDRSTGSFGIKKITELIRALLAVFREYRPDVIHVQYLAPGLVPIIAAKFAGVPIMFATVHIAGSIAYGRKAKILLRIASRFCTTFFCVSKDVEEFWFGSSQVFDPEQPQRFRKHFTIYNTVDIEKIVSINDTVDKQELKAALGASDASVIGIVGRLALQKGHTILLDAMVDVIKKIPAVILLAIGDGPDREKLENKANSLGIQEHVHWLGLQQQDEVFKIYSIIDVLVMPSLYEGFGLTATEGMSAGIPIVGSKVAGLTEIIQDGITGYLVPVNDSNKLAKALIDLLINPDNAKKMGQEGLQRVSEQFSMEKFRKSWLAAYEWL